MNINDSQQAGEISLHLILTIFLGIGMALFGILAVVSYTDSRNIHATFNDRVKTSTTSAIATTKAKDKEEFRIASELPYRTFTAEPTDGSFEIQIPKNWSIYTGRSTTGVNQLNLISDPQAVVENLPANTPNNTHALRLQIIRRTPAEVLRSYDDKLKKNSLKSSPTTVSGISGTRLEGLLDDQKHTGVAIILAVRDKTMLLSTENNSYLNEFNKIITDAKINP